MRLVLLCTLSLLTGCSEYGLTGELSPDAEGGTPRDVVTPRPRVQDPLCEMDVPDGFGVTLIEDCRREPVIGTFDPVVEWTWTDRRVEIPPLVANMNDDNGDGIVDENDVPDIIVTSFVGGGYGGFGHLDLIDGASRTTLWTTDRVMDKQVWALAGLAVADLEADGVMDILVTVDGGVARLDATGAAQWVTPLPMRGGGGATISLADMESDGVAEIVVGGTVLEADGRIRWRHPAHTGVRFSGSFPVDVDGDGFMEVVAGGILLNYDGTERWRQDQVGGWPATVDLDLDGVPEFVTIRGGQVSVHDIEGAEVWSFSEGPRGGAPTVADFDGDGYPEIGYASQTHYRVLDTDGSLLWQREIRDGSSGFTSSAVFDFEPDGAAEVVYADEYTLWVFDGSSGAVELELNEHNSGTRYEYPTIADVDGDGSAEILVPHGRNRPGTAVQGLSILGSRTDSWAAARPIWNQHSYHATHIDDDGTIPVVASTNWSLYNTFRAGNSEVPLGLTTPDLDVSWPESCTVECYRDEVVWYVPVMNSGLADGGPFEVEVVRRDDGETLLTETVETLAAGDMMWLGPFRSTRMDFGRSGLEIRVDPDGGSGHGAVYECIENNNVYVWADFPCEG